MRQTPRHDVHLSLTDRAECEAAAKQLLAIVKPDWPLDKVQFEVFTAGITNKIFAAWVGEGEGDRVIFRVFGQNTEKIIDRQHELESWQVFAAHGLAAPLHALFANGIVCGYQKGTSISVDMVRRDDIQSEIARTLARTHSLPTIDEPALFRLCHAFMKEFHVDRYCERRRAEYAAHFEPFDLQKQLKELEEVIRKVDSPLAFCHNDLLVHNILYDENDGSIGFIDYEYANTNYALFDIANHFCEWAGVDNPDYSLCPTPAQIVAWLRVYLLQKDGAVDEEKLKRWSRDVYLFMASSHFMWSVWALAQSQNSLIDFDYLQYAITRHTMYIACLNEYHACSKN